MRLPDRAEPTSAPPARRAPRRVQLALVLSLLLGVAIATADAVPKPAPPARPRNWNAGGRHHEPQIERQRAAQTHRNNLRRSRAQALQRTAAASDARSRAHQAASKRLLNQRLQQQRLASKSRYDNRSSSALHQRQRAAREKVIARRRAYNGFSNPWSTYE